MPTLFRSSPRSSPIPPTEWNTTFRASSPTGAVRACDLLIEFLLGAFVLLSPLAYGAAAAWGVEIVAALVTMIAVALAVRCLLTHAWPPIGRLPAIAILSFTALILLQWMPLPKAVVAILSPHSFALRQTLLKGLPAWENARFTTLTFYPLMTHHQLILVLCMATIFAAAVTVYQRQEQIERLLAAIAIAGAAVALFALAQNIFGYQHVYWLNKPKQPNCSPFANYSEFSQFMNLSIAAMIALLVLLAGKSSRAAKVLTIALWLTVALSATVIVLAVSRNGIISMLVAGTVMIVAFTLHRVIQPRHALLLLVAAAVVMIAFFLGFDAVSRRLSSLSHPETPYSKRWIILLSLTDSWRQFPLFGTGLGTFQYIFPMVDRQIRVESYLSHAENEYAQMLTETGILGLLCVGLFLFEIVRSYIRCIRRSRSAMTSVAIALGFGILAIVIHSFTDFSQHVPGIACLTAIYAGWIFRISRDPQGSAVSSAGSARRTLGWKFAWLVPPALAACGLSFVLWEDHNRVGDTFNNRAQALFDESLRDGEPLTDADYPRLAADADAAASAQPENVKFLYGAQIAHWTAIRHAAGADTAEVIPTPQVIADAAKIVAGMRAARMACPTFRMNYLTAAQIEAFVLVVPEAGDDFRRAALTGDMDPLALYEAARYDLRDHKAADAADKLRRLEDTDAPRIVALLLGGNVSNEIFLQVADGKPLMLRVLSALPDEQGGNAALRHEAADRLLTLLETRCRLPHASGMDLAMFAALCVQNDHLADALDAYQRALQQDPSNLDWHIALARTLDKAGYHADAVREAQRCLAQDPHSPNAQQLLSDLQSGV